MTQVRSLNLGGRRIQLTRQGGQTPGTVAGARARDQCGSRAVIAIQEWRSDFYGGPRLRTPGGGGRAAEPHEILQPKRNNLFRWAVQRKKKSRPFLLG